MMIREDIIKLAREAGFDPHDMSDDFTCNLEDIERFATLVAVAERESCAKVCETFYNHEAKDCAAAIRARSEQ